MCDHHNFHVDAKINRLEDTHQFVVDITIKCIDCGKPFQFLGLEAGIDLQGAKCSIDGLEARIAITPQGVKPNPLQRMAFGISEIHIRKL